MKKKLVSTMLILSMAISMIACGKKDADKDKDDSGANQSAADIQPVDDSVAFWEVRSYLTGEFIDPELRNQRPKAIMIENTKAAIPQYGIENAGIVYECVVEGGITRMMGIFDTYTGMDQIGNVRSSRPYFVYFASEYDAIYTHAGGNPVAFELIDDKHLVENINLLKNEGKKGVNAGYRTGKSEHTLYTYSEGIDKGIEKQGYDRALPEGYEPHFQFAAEGNNLENGQDCQAIQLYYYTNKPYWIYNPDDGLYYRYEFNKKQVDGLTGNQLTAKNIIIQNVEWFTYQGSQYLGYLLSYNSGAGKYITNGKMIDIRWEKMADTDITHYYNAETGEEIQLNVGNTWIQAVQGAGEGDFTDGNEYYADKSQFSKAQ